MSKIDELLQELEADEYEIVDIFREIGDNGEEIVVTLKIMSPSPQFKPHFYTVTIKNMTSLERVIDEAKESFRQRFGKKFKYYKEGKRIKKDEYSREFDIEKEIMGLTKLSKEDKRKIHRRLEKKGYSLNLEDVWTSKGWMNTKQALRVYGKDDSEEEMMKAYLERNKKFVNLSTKIHSLDKRVTANRKQVISLILEEKKKEVSGELYFKLHTYRNKRAISIFKKGKRGLYARWISTKK